MALSRLITALFICITSTWAAATVEYSQGTACSEIPAPKLPGASIISFSAKEQLNVTGLFVNESIPKIETMSGLDICNVEITLTHSAVNDSVGFQIWLPLKGWNTRFLGLGGGGYVAGHSGVQGLGLGVKQGFAAGITDGGKISDENGFLLSDMIKEPGVIDAGRLADFSTRSLHELSIVGKAITASFYGKAPRYSYWNGCSTGGRQGYTLAQVYPKDFNGILANAPALYFPSLLVAIGWAQLTMRVHKHEVPTCIFSAFYRASVRACDGLDGVIDNVISNPNACRFNPYSIVGQRADADCGTSRSIISLKDALVVKAIMEGPKSPRGTQLWEPLSWGMNYTSVAPTDVSFAKLWDSWIQILVKKDPNFDINTYNTLDQFVEYMAVSQAEYDGFIGANNPDLSAFRDTGGKLLTWHGMADDIIPMNNTVRYRRTVERVMGGNELVNNFYRVFLAPGMSHCLKGNGAYPMDAMDSLIRWVEKGKAPNELHGKTNDWQGKPAERIICPFPLVARFDGKGDPTKAGSYSCAHEYAAPVSS